MGNILLVTNKNFAAFTNIDELQMTKKPLNLYRKSGRPFGRPVILFETHQNCSDDVTILI